MPPISRGILERSTRGKGQRQTKYVESVNKTGKTRVQIPPSPPNPKTTIYSIINSVINTIYCGFSFLGTV